MLSMLTEARHDESEAKSVQLRHKRVSTRQSVKKINRGYVLHVYELNEGFVLFPTKTRF